MIDKLPLDLFGEGEPEPAPPAPDQSLAPTCPWCSAIVTSDATTCPECDASIVHTEPAPDDERSAAQHEGVCQWCGAAIAPNSDACPACGWDALGDNEAELPGLTTPLSEAEIRSLYGGDEAEPDHEADAILLVAEIISTLLPRG